MYFCLDLMTMPTALKTPTTTSKFVFSRNLKTSIILGLLWISVTWLKCVLCMQAHYSLQTLHYHICPTVIDSLELWINGAKLSLILAITSLTLHVKCSGNGCVPLKNKPLTGPIFLTAYGFTKWHLVMAISKSPNTSAVTLQNIFDLCVYIVYIYIYIYVCVCVNLYTQF